MPTVLPSQWTQATFNAHDTLLVGGNTWDPMSANQTYSLVGTTQNGDSQACHFEVRQGDYALDSATGNPVGGDNGVKNRSELSGFTYQGEFNSNPTGHIYVNYDFVLSASCPTNDADWFVFGQFHQVNNDGNSPPFEIDLYHNFTPSAGATGPTDCQAIVIGTGTTNSGITYTTLYHDPLNSPLVRGRLYTMSIDINFDNSSNGSVHITRDDHQGGGPVTLVNYSGPVGWGSTMQGVYWKHGIYRAASASTQIITYSNHTISQTPPSGGGGGGGAMTYIAPSAWVSGTTDPTTTGILYHANKYTVENAGKTWSISSTDDNTIRFEVQSGDKWSGDGTAAKERSELDGDASGDGTIFPQSQPLIVIYDIMIEAGTVNNEPTSGFGPVIGQFHHDNQTGGWSPPYECDLGNNDFLSITINNAGNNANSWSNYPTIWTDNAAIVRGTWYHFHIEVMFDPVNGYLKVWKDHNQIVNYSGALGWSTMGNVYWKFGLYRGSVSYTTAANYKNLYVSIPLAINPSKGRLGDSKLKGALTGGASLTRAVLARVFSKSSLKSSMSLKTRLSARSRSSSGLRTTFFEKLPPVFLQAHGFLSAFARMFQAALVIPSQFQPQPPPPPLTWNYTLTYNPHEATRFKTFAYAYNFAIAHGLQDTCLILHTTQNNFINARKGQKAQDIYLIYDQKKREFYANITPKPDGTF